jgi:hypothetical protein
MVAMNEEKKKEIKCIHLGNGITGQTGDGGR